MVELEKQDGIREVVEWVEKNSLVNLSFTSGNVRVIEEFAWQEQKDLWGLEGTKKERLIPKD